MTINDLIHGMARAYLSFMTAGMTIHLPRNQPCQAARKVLQTLLNVDVDNAENVESFQNRRRRDAEWR